MRRRVLKIKTYKDRAGNWRWVIMAMNNKKIASSGECFYSKRNCQKSIANLMNLISDDGTDIENI